MKKSLLLIALLCMSIAPLFAQVDCGVVDCPGRCGRFVDANQDGFCDHGHLSQPQQPTPAPTETAPQQPTVAPTEKTSKPVQKAATEPAVEEPAAQPDTAATMQPATSVKEEGRKSESGKTVYPVLPILCGLLALYVASCVLVRCGAWSKAAHRKAWNVALAVTFLVSCLLGLLLAVFINYDYYPAAYTAYLHWHVWFGIAMTVVAVFHLLWHLNYFKAIFARRKA